MQNDLSFSELFEICKYIGKTLYPKENLVIHVFSFRYGAIKLKVNNPNNPGIYVNKILVQSYIWSRNETQPFGGFIWIIVYGPDRLSGLSE